MSALLTYLQVTQIYPCDLRSWCQAARLQVGQRSQRRGFPPAFQRIPPSSQTDRSVPQALQRAIHDRDSASMAVAHDRGTMDVMSF
jgi:hypothetical protein